ncbi:Mrp/NBP35 family ATP-binding protein [Actinopolymorpha rutila]|uniref:Iron-sulfur cluster carrier protein n=1 Tax=Actinopolymorpha rutila TaxID=446787 RepID=A0A852Z9L0_9ACTN|nr:P-loop NTPase [Actinopolymorpha rutila]NYH88895.1 ATP-binding protein involved in chromosome partitioning [Actinopolymorpha rutila]
MTVPNQEQLHAALGGVLDPEIRRPITELGMVRSVQVRPDGTAEVTVLLTVAGCPMRETLTRDVTKALSALPGVRDVAVTLDVMSAEQRQELQGRLRGGGTAPAKENPFARADSLTRIYAIASGKGGVGKSSVTVNLAVSMAAQGLKVGLLDADVYGHSVPAMVGIADQRPTRVEEMIMPVPAYDVKVMSIGMLKPGRQHVVAWRGPMLDRALGQMLSDVYWGDLDVLLLDLPPGTGDMAISVGQQLANAEVVVVTTPQEAAAEVAERAGTIASMLNQKVVGVVENMSWLPCPHCGPSHRIDVFGTGGGTRVAATLSERFGYDVPLLAEVPLDPRLRTGGDTGRPVVLDDPGAAASDVLSGLAKQLADRRPSLVGRSLGLTPTAR